MKIEQKKYYKNNRDVILNRIKRILYKQQRINIRAFKK